MASLLDRIKADSLVARKARVATVGAFSALIGEIETKEKTNVPPRPLTEEEVVAVVKKMLKGVDETLTALRGTVHRAGAVDKAEQEKVLLEAYLPQQMSEAEIEAIASERKAAGDDMGKTMAFLKANFAGAYDGKLASAVVRRVQA